MLCGSVVFSARRSGSLRSHKRYRWCSVGMVRQQSQLLCLAGGKKQFQVLLAGLIPHHSVSLGSGHLPWILWAVRALNSPTPSWQCQKFCWVIPGDSGDISCLGQNGSNAASLLIKLGHWATEQSQREMWAKSQNRELPASVLPWSILAKTLVLTGSSHSSKSSHLLPAFLNTLKAVNEGPLRKHKWIFQWGTMCSSSHSHSASQC